MLKGVAIFSKDNNQRTRDGVQKLINELNHRGVTIHLFRKLGEEQSKYRGDLVEGFTDISSLKQRPDMFFSVGGDGTFLETVMKVKDLGIPIAGVNTGRMGFLANIPGEDIGNSVEMLCN